MIAGQDRIRVWTRTVVAMTQRPRSPERGRPGCGAAPAELLRPDSPDPAEVAARLEAIGAGLLLPADPGWPLAADPPDPPCAWLFVAGQVPPGPAASVAVVGGRRASPLRRAAARALGAGLAAAGWSVVSGGAVGVDAAAHGGALDGGGRTVVVLGCGLDVAYPRANAGLVREGPGRRWQRGERAPARRPASAGPLPAAQPADRRPGRRRRGRRGRRGLRQPVGGQGGRRPR